MTKRLRGVLLALVWLAAVSGGPAQADGGDAVVQFSTIDALLGGLYDGVVEVAAVKARGDLGIGTFDGLDGEMVVLDGQVYRVSVDGRARVVSDRETAPFATVAFFHPERSMAVPEGTGFEAFQARVDATLPSANLFHALRGEGRFKSIRVRSVPKQAKPYRPLVEVVKEQAVFDLKDVEGVLVGFRSPPFVKGINAPGYHLHFLTADRQAGGHVLGFTVDRLDLKVDTLSRFVVELPDSAGFGAADLAGDRKEELQKVEGQR